MQRIEWQRRQDSDKAELSRLLPAAGVERLTDDAAKRKALDQLPRRISGALMKQGEAWMLQPHILLDHAREGLQNKQEREWEQEQMRLRRGY